MTRQVDAELPPLEALGVIGAVVAAVAIALQEAVIAGVLTPEERKSISTRADELKDALIGGKIVDTDKQGLATIREPTEDEVEGLEGHPAATRAKTLDI